jgi:hypothetical protein
MERGASKHGPRVDDALEQEVASLLRGEPIEPRTEATDSRRTPGHQGAFGAPILALCRRSPSRPG